MFLIDGYNLIFVINRGKPDLGAIEKRRDDLLHLLEQYAQRNAVKIQVVFDSKEKIFPRGRKERRDRVEIIFSPPNRSADDIIIETAASIKDKKSLTVVSSDRQIIRAAQKRRLGFLTSGDFLKQLVADLNRAQGPSAEYREKLEGISEGQVDAWMKEFGLEDGNP